MKFMSLALALLLLCTSYPIVVHATEVSEDVSFLAEAYDTSDINPRAMTYESVWLNSGATGSFKVHTEIKGKTYFTLRIESVSNNSWCNLRIQRPDGTYCFGKVLSLNPGHTEEVVYILAGIPGDYTIHYEAGTDQGMRIMCWIH